MTSDQAIMLAIEALEAQIATLVRDADLIDIWSIPQPSELITCDYRTPRRLAASEQRKKLRQAIATLQQMRPRQVVMDLEAA